MQLTELRGRRVAVWGTGREGVAAVNAIAPVGPADLVAVMDRETYAANPWTGRLAEAAPLHTGPAALEALLRADVVVRSPVIGETHPWVVRLRQQGVPITSGTALWMAEHAAATIGVTGSKGKSTTTNLISHLLTAVDRPNAIGGNIGVPVLDLPPADRYVLELSMYQCADLTDSPEVAVLTSLVPEHLDWAGGEAEYYRHKLNIVEHGPRQVVFNAYDERLRAELTARAGLPLVPAGRPPDRRPGSESPPARTAPPGCTSTTSRSFRVPPWRWSAGTTSGTSVSHSPRSGRSASTVSPSGSDSPPRWPPCRRWSTGSPRSRTRPASPSSTTRSRPSRSRRSTPSRRTRPAR